MATYVHTPTQIEAFLLTAATAETEAGWPKWLKAARKAQPGSPGSIYPSPHDGVLSMNGALGPPQPCIGQWIVRETSGRLYMLTPEVFEANYEAA